MFEGVPKVVQDLGGKPSTMRVGALLGWAGGVAILVGSAFGYASVEVTAQDALLLVLIASGAKVLQRSTEGKETVGDKDSNPEKEK